MTTHTTTKNPIDSAVAFQPEAVGAKLRPGPIARLLGKASRLSSEYANYQMEHYEERKLAI